MSSCAPPKRELAFFIKVDYYELELTPRGKVRCPLCCDDMWGEWAWERHRRCRHVLCECGRWFLARGLKFCREQT